MRQNIVNLLLDIGGKSKVNAPMQRCRVSGVFIAGFYCEPKVGTIFILFSDQYVVILIGSNFCPRIKV